MVSEKMYNLLVQLERGYRHTTVRHIKWPQEDRNTLQTIVLEAEKKGYIRINSKERDFGDWWITIVEDGAVEVTTYEFEYYKAHPISQKRERWSFINFVKTVLSIFASGKTLLKK